MTARQVIEVVLTTATEIGDASIYGHGLLNLERAVKGPIEFGHPSLIEGNDSIFAPIFAVNTQGYDSVWSNDITGDGGFSKAGAGMLTLTGANTYTGDTTITGGVLRVDGSIATSDLAVGSDATLQGIGTVGNTMLAGILSPGNSVGTLTVEGNLDLAAGSTYLYEIGADQNGDLVVVTGTATIDDEAVFELSAEDGVYLDRLYPMIQASTLNGTFENLHTNYTFIDLDFVTETTGSGSELGMVAERNQTPMAAFAQRNNQRSVANAIDGQSGLAEPYNDVVLNEDPTQLPNWYQDWSGEIYSANQAALIYNSRLVAQVVNWRLQDSWLDATQSARLQQVGQSGNPTAATTTTTADTTVWAQAYGNWDSFSADANAQKATANSGGFILGVDHQVNPHLRLGGGLVVSNTSTSVAASQATTQGYGMMAYASYDNKSFRLNGGVVQSWNVADVNRTLPLDDQGNARGTVASRSTQLFADLSTPITLYKQQNQQNPQNPQTTHHTTLSPFAQVSQTWLHTSNFGENGAEAGLSGQATNASTGFGTLGARLSHEWQTSQTRWQASLSAGWQRAWGDLAPATTLAFATGPDFTVSSAAMARDAAVIEVGIGASLGPSSRLNVVYATTLSGQSSSQMLQAQLQWWF
jgi:subtilase-type serine protease